MFDDNDIVVEGYRKAHWFALPHGEKILVELIWQLLTAAATVDEPNAFSGWSKQHFWFLEPHSVHKHQTYINMILFPISPIFLPYYSYGDLFVYLCSKFSKPKCLKNEEYNPYSVPKELANENRKFCSYIKGIPTQEQQSQVILLPRKSSEEVNWNAYEMLETKPWRTRRQSGSQVERLTIPRTFGILSFFRSKRAFHSFNVGIIPPNFSRRRLSVW